MQIFAYTDVVCGRVFDVIPKQVHHFLVYSLCDGFVMWMLEKVTRTDLKAWFGEDTKTLRKRRDIARKLGQFQLGVKILEKARNIE